MRVNSRFAAFIVALVLQGCANSMSPESVAPGNSSPTPTPVQNAGPYPIVLMHGMGGFTQIAGVDYFNGVPEALQADGWAVFETSVDPFNTVAVRAAQAASQIDTILAGTGAQKVILIGHSQGGLDARYLVSSLGYGSKVKTVATLATPHHGSKVADIALGLAPGNSAAALAAFSDALLGTVTGTQADIQTQIQEMTASYCDTVFNPANPDDPQVKYYSATGQTQPWVTVDPLTTDIVNPLLLASYWIVQANEGANDGLVSVHSGTWGTFLGPVPADHFSEIGQPPLTPHPSFNQVTWFRKLAAFLEGTGPQP